MKRFPIFRAGKHTASSGQVIEFTAEQLKAAVAAYSPELHEAPIVVGHPKDNHPAYGWVSGLAFDETTSEILADPAQLDPAFDEMVGAGRFKKRSASWYLPDSPNNPAPGTLYLRHVGFLGAQPPAVKGLKDVQFNDAEQGLIEYGENRWAWSSMAAIARGFREWLIGEKGLETADKIVPNFYITDLDAAAKADDVTAAAMPAYSEGNDMDPIKEARLAALEAENTTQKATIATLQSTQRPADFAERETALAAREASIAAAELLAARAGVEARVDTIIRAGRLLPVQKKGVTDFAMSLAAKEPTIDFGEGDKAKKVTQRDAYLLQIEAGPKLVEFGELAPSNGAAPDLSAVDPQKIADKAGEIRAAAMAKGKELSFTEAVAQATTELTAAA